MQHTPASHRSQRGVALITALVIVSLASITAIAMTEKMQISTRRTANVLHADQRYFLTLGSEAWAKGQLIRDKEEDAKHDKYDGLDEDWAEELPATAIDVGQIEAKIIDLQARFNLNNLYLEAEANEDSKTEFARQLAYFKRLLQALGLEPGIAQAIADWIDADINPSFPDGAEDNEYLGREPPYRTPNSQMTSVTELRLIAGVTPEIYDKLEPYVTTLPTASKLNVNTADPILLGALSDNLDESSSKSLSEGRKEDPFTTIKAFKDRLKSILGDNNNQLEEIASLVDVSSHYFLLKTTVSMDTSSQTLQTIFTRDDQGTRVLQRAIGLF
jgi:general secretion pathway protein K